MAHNQNQNPNFSQLQNAKHRMLKHQERQLALQKTLREEAEQHFLQFNNKDERIKELTAKLDAVKDQQSLTTSLRIQVDDLSRDCVTKDEQIKELTAELEVARAQGQVSTNSAPNGPAKEPRKDSCQLSQQYNDKDDQIQRLTAELETARDRQMHFPGSDLTTSEDADWVELPTPNETSMDQARLEDLERF